MSVEPIEKSIDLDLNFPKVEERYFEHYFFVPLDIKRKKFVQKSLLFELKNKVKCESTIACSQNGDVHGITPMEINNSESREKGLNEYSNAENVKLQDSGYGCHSPNVGVKFDLKNFDGADTQVMIHSNKICVIGLSPLHPILKEDKDICKVDFNVDGVDRLSNRVSGKGKRGAQIVGCFSPICKIHCLDGSNYTIYCGTRGKLVEVNERLVKNPQLVKQFPQSDGYLAVVLPKLHESDKIKELLLTKDQYKYLYS